MAEKKETKKSSSASESLVPKSKKKTQSKKADESSAKKTTRKAESFEPVMVKKERKPLPENSPLFLLMPWVSGLFGVLLAICLLVPSYMGFLGGFATLLVRLFSYGAWALPLFLIAGAFKIADDMKKEQVGQKVILGAACVIFIAMFCQLAIIPGGEGLGSDFKAFWSDAAHYKNGGLVGSVLGSLLFKITGAGAIYISAIAAVILAIFLFGSTPVDLFVYLRDKIREYIHDKRAERELMREAEAEAEAEATEKDAENEESEETPSLTKSNIDVDIETGEVIGDDDGIVDKKSEILEPEKDVSEELIFDTEEITDTQGAATLADILSEGAALSAEDTIPAQVDDSAQIEGESDGTEIIPDDEENEDLVLEVESGKLVVESHPTLEELYCFPPINLLGLDPNPSSYSITDEHKEKAANLVDTLSSFGVRTNVSEICCGPTVTRYELQPEVGVRVRSIQNLSDDIALHLRAKGVRIEAPIPGKNAVGIEVPNDTVSTVYIRDLIERDQFRDLKSKISVCLGKDVAGAPVYMDIAKMPHLLIAGATGTGKSVCINSFIISILYKARPDEVKFIMIDPKKVEFSMYKGIPHLLVPVVNEPKKAAGALSWAVAEMERRFALIEEVGVRNIAGYNEVTKNDPEKPHMSQIVIIIDELADLMMTARDEVENSICRLAQKGRAAGMHIVIGTQRPSVDVITGLIKANVPSRIACTVASQVDSRTVLDIAGAEKLLGKGDMLYAPVGSLKPMRVQGAFVSDSEVEAITTYLRENCHTEYDSSIIESIEREAERCGEKKKGKSDFDGEKGSSGALSDGDEMIMPAIEVAVNAGQLSTSLLQRKLSLGYARAARIVDTLEKMGIVSGFEGSKPRRVLISQEQYLEMKMNRSDNE